MRNPLESFRNSLEALHVNFSGGEDISNLVSDFDYNDKTNYVWRNILRKTSEKLSKGEVEIIIEIHEEYIDLHEKLYTEENISHIILNLSKVDIHGIDREDIRDILDALKNYEENKNFS